MFTTHTFICLAAMLTIGVNMNYNELINATWDMFPLSVGIEYALISMGKSTPIREQKVADAIGLGMNA